MFQRIDLPNRDIKNNLTMTKAQKIKLMRVLVIKYSK